MEREDEFDIHPIEEIHKRRLDLEDEAIDVLGTELAKSDHEEDSFRMPVVLGMDLSDEEEDIVAIGPGTMRRRSPGANRSKQSGTDLGDSGDEKNGVRVHVVNGGVKAPSLGRKR